ncbi:hypothetical protein B0H10DRAFT_1995654 [Mycena sp. CBHHK59/15]|nr:hypothetical protein B0H10DRAFT_1995654 [Mycena sp. CBHHK59/15]
MTATIASSFSDFLKVLTGIAFNLFNSLLAVFHALLLLGKDILSSCVNLAQSFVALVLGLLQGVYGLVAANLLAIAVIGGAYYFYTSRQTKGRGKRRA